MNLKTAESWAKDFFTVLPIAALTCEAIMRTLRSDYSGAIFFLLIALTLAVFEIRVRLANTAFDELAALVSTPTPEPKFQIRYCHVCKGLPLAHATYVAKNNLFHLEEAWLECCDISASGNTPAEAITAWNNLEQTP